MSTPTPTKPARQINILVVIPKFTSSTAQDYIFPVGIGYIVAALKRQGFSARGLDLNRYDAPVQEVLSRAIQEHDIHVVATGTVSAHFDKVRIVLEAARAARPRIITVVGGGVMSSEPEAMMEMLNPHFGVLGEGEVTIVELARELSTTRNFEGIDGLIFRDPDGRFRTTAGRAAIRDLDELPFPDEDLLEGFYQGQARVYNLVGSRSCPYKCTFCYHPIGNVYRQRSLDNVFQEVELSYHKFHPFHYRVIDELFSVKRERVLEFCRRIKPYNVKWDVQMRVSDVDQELLETMRDAGCVVISYGLESGSQTVLESMRKHTKVKDLVRAVDLTYDARIQVQGNYIFGDPAETVETAVETFSLWLKQRKAGINMIPIEVYPGTPLYKSAVKEGLIPDPAAYIASGCRSINLMGMSERDALQIMLLMYLLVTTYNHIPAEILDCRPCKTVKNKEGEATQLFELTVRCPHCKENATYKDFPMYLGNKLSCKLCNRKFDVQPLSQWRHTPASYVLAANYEYAPAHTEEMRRFLKMDGWRGNQINVEGFIEVKLFGVHYLVPSSVTLDHIRYGRMRVYMIDPKTQRMDPIVVGDCDYTNLHHPFYLKNRVSTLVGGWRAQKRSVVIAGPGGELRNLLQWTTLKESRLVGVLPLEQGDSVAEKLGLPVLSMSELEKHPPGVVLVAATKNQRALSELLAGYVAPFGVETVTLYESGSHY